MNKNIQLVDNFALPTEILEQIDKEGMSMLFGGGTNDSFKHINNGKNCNEINNDANCDVINNGKNCAAINNSGNCSAINNKRNCSN